MSKNTSKQINERYWSKFGDVYVILCRRQNQPITISLAYISVSFQKPSPTYYLEVTHIIKYSWSKCPLGIKPIFNAKSDTRHKSNNLLVIYRIENVTWLLGPDLVPNPDPNRSKIGVAYSCLEYGYRNSKTNPATKLLHNNWEFYPIIWPQSGLELNLNRSRTGCWIFTMGVDIENSEPTQPAASSSNLLVGFNNKDNKGGRVIIMAKKREKQIKISLMRTSFLRWENFSLLAWDACIQSEFTDDLKIIKSGYGL